MKKNQTPTKILTIFCVVAGFAYIIARIFSLIEGTFDLYFFIPLFATIVIIGIINSPRKRFKENFKKLGFKEEGESLKRTVGNTLLEAVITKTTSFGNKKAKQGFEIETKIELTPEKSFEIQAKAPLLFGSYLIYDGSFTNQKRVNRNEYDLHHLGSKKAVEKANALFNSGLVKEIKTKPKLSLGQAINAVASLVTNSNNQPIEWYLTLSLKYDEVMNEIEIEEKDIQLIAELFALVKENKK
ncbi:MAG: hypothetical protein ABH803_01835 [Candidatus Micrarchaeota archaeon]